MPGDPRTCLISCTKQSLGWSITKDLSPALGSRRTGRRHNTGKINSTFKGCLMRKRLKGGTKPCRKRKKGGSARFAFAKSTHRWWGSSSADIFSIRSAWMATSRPRYSPTNWISSVLSKPAKSPFLPTTYSPISTETSVKNTRSSLSTSSSRRTLRILPGALLRVALPFFSSTKP